MVWTEEKLGPIIHSILNPDEEVLSLYQSKTTKSIYGCILWNSYYYKVFRVSNHPSQSTYKQPTFYDFHGEFYMKERFGPIFTTRTVGMNLVSKATTFFFFKSYGMKSKRWRRVGKMVGCRFA